MKRPPVSLPTKTTLLSMALGLAITGTALSFTERDGAKLDRLAELLPNDTVVLLALDELDQFVSLLSDILVDDSALENLLQRQVPGGFQQAIAGLSDSIGFNPTTASGWESIGVELGLPIGFGYTSTAAPLLFLPVTDFTLLHGHINEHSSLEITTYDHNGVEVYGTNNDAPFYWIHVDDYLVATISEPISADAAGEILVVATSGDQQLSSLESYQRTTELLDPDWGIAAWTNGISSINGGMSLLTSLQQAVKDDEHDWIVDLLSVNSTSWALSSRDGDIIQTGATSFNDDSPLLSYLSQIDQTTTDTLSGQLNVSSISVNRIRNNWPALLEILRSVGPLSDNWPALLEILRSVGPLSEAADSLTDQLEEVSIDQLAQFLPATIGATVGVNETDGIYIWVGGDPMENSSLGHSLILDGCPASNANHGDTRQGHIELERGSGCLLPSRDFPVLFYSVDDLFGFGCTGPIGSDGETNDDWGGYLVETATTLNPGGGYGATLSPRGQAAINADGILTGYMDNSALIDFIMSRLPSGDAKDNNPTAEAVYDALRGDITYRIWLEDSLLRGESAWRSGLDVGGSAGVAMVGILVAIAIPNFVEMQRRAKRAEVPSNVAGIRHALLAYDAEFDVYIEAERHPLGEPGPESRDWGNGNPRFNQLGWAPDGNVRGQYWVTTTPAGKGSRGGDFTVWGRSDIDGDGIFATYTATRSINPAFHNNNDTF